MTGASGGRSQLLSQAPAPGAFSQADKTLALSPLSGPQEAADWERRGLQKGLKSPKKIRPTPD